MYRQQKRNQPINEERQLNRQLQQTSLFTTRQQNKGAKETKEKAQKKATTERENQQATNREMYETDNTDSPT